MDSSERSEYHELENQAISANYRQAYVPKIGNDLVDFCMNHCPYKECKTGSCKEFFEFKKKYKEKKRK